MLVLTLIRDANNIIEILGLRLLNLDVVKSLQSTSLGDEGLALGENGSHDDRGVAVLNDDALLIVDERERFG